MNLKHFIPIIATTVLTACNSVLDNTVDAVLKSSRDTLTDTNIKWNVTGGYNSRGFSVGFNSANKGVRLNNQDGQRESILNHQDNSGFQRSYVSTGDGETNVSIFCSNPLPNNVEFNYNGKVCIESFTGSQGVTIRAPTNKDKLKPYLEIHETAFQNFGPGTKNFEKRLKRR